MAPHRDNLDPIIEVGKDIGDDGDDKYAVNPNDLTIISADGSDEEDVRKGGATTATRKRCNRWLPLGVGAATLAAIGVGVYFFLDNNKVALETSQVQNANFQGTVSKLDLFQHTEPDDCWLLIGDSVYDLTDYASDHPGGGDLITDLCGTDGTKEYEMTHALSLMKTLPETLLGTIEPGYVPPVIVEDEEGDGDDGFVYEPPATDPPQTDPPQTDPPQTDPPQTEPPQTDPPVETDPPLTFPPDGTEPPVQTEPPVETDPPVATNPPGMGDVIGGLATLTAFISEIHYDNIGGDVNQMIEVAYSNHLDVSGYSVEFYRGNSGKVYDVQSLQAFTIGNSVNGLTFASRKVKSFQNGPDGVALIDNNGEIVEFLSYEGTIVPIEGVAAGVESVDIGISQSGLDPIGWTLQKTGDNGCLGDSFVWGVNGPGTPGNVNQGMTVSCYAPGEAVPAPAPWAETFAPTPACYAQHYDLSSLAEHSTPGDCWEAMFGIVYDFSVWAFEHTGG